MGTIKPAGKFVIIVILVAGIGYGVNEYMDHKAKNKPVAVEAQASAPEVKPEPAPTAQPLPKAEPSQPQPATTADGAALNNLLQSGRK